MILMMIMSCCADRILVCFNAWSAPTWVELSSHSWPDHVICRSDHMTCPEMMKIVKRQLKLRTLGRAVE